MSADSDLLKFFGSAAAERYILQHDSLKKASAFSWWFGKGNLWGVAVDRGNGPEFVRRAHGLFIANGKILEVAMACRDLTENVNALLGPPAKTRVRQLESQPPKRIDYKKTKHPNFSSRNRPKR